MYRLHYLFIVLFCVLTAFKPDKPAYSIFNKTGKHAKYEKMLKTCQTADIVLFGKYHDNTILHWLQLKLTKNRYSAKGAKLILGAEMLESDNQHILDEYLTDVIYENRFEAEARL